jgi:hypothetical protein
MISISDVRVPTLRDHYGSLSGLAASIRSEGLRRPITAWKDGTLISGARRHRASLMLGQESIPAVFVSTVEDAAKRLLGDNEDTHHALPYKWSEACRLWQLLRELDAPAAAVRANENRQRGVKLRRQTTTGKRPAGRYSSRTSSYVLDIACVPFDISSATAHRIEVVYRAANAVDPSERRELARELLLDIDNRGGVWPNYRRLMATRPAAATRPRPVETVAPAASARQVAAWDRCLPQLEGLLAGLRELGPPNPGLTWGLVAPVHARLTTVRHDLDKIIRQMRESS